MKFRTLLRNITPQWMLQIWRAYRKRIKNKSILKAKESGVIWTAEQLLAQIQSAGIQKGDSVLVHASLSQIGYVDNGPITVVEALLNAVGVSGNLLMPTSPNAGLQLEFARSKPVFDVLHTPSKMGAISEYFRKLPGVVRSIHPTEPISCWGEWSNYFTEEHFNEPTPYTAKSPFYKLIEKKGKILYIGVSLDNAGTSLHVLEDFISEFKFPVYFPELFDMEVVLPTGEQKMVQTYVHDPTWSAKRKCDELLPLFIQEGAAQVCVLGNAKMWVFDAFLMFETMKKAYQNSGITMYTPHGR